MKVLIISSEPLNPASITSSIFELNQARAIKKAGVDVCILAVRNDYSINRLARSIFSRLKRERGRDEDLKECSIKILFSLLLESSVRILFNRKFPVNKFLIEGIEVYESRVQYIKFRTIYASLHLWRRAGLDGFNVYRNEKGTPDIIHAHNRYLYAGALANYIYRRIGIRYVLTEHSSFYLRDLVAPKDKQVLRSSIDESEYFITVSSSLSNSVQQKLGKLRKEPLTIPNILGDGFIEKTLPAPTGDSSLFSFVNVANLVEIKDQKTLILAFKEVVQHHKTTRLYIGGDGVLRNELQEMVKVFDIADKVFFCGKLNQNEVIGLMDKSDAFVLSSRQETFGVVIIEALARGKPVITTRCGGPESLIDNSNGLIVPTGDANELCNAMLLMVRNRDRYHPGEIRRAAIEKYSPEVVANTLKKMYLSVINS